MLHRKIIRNNTLVPIDKSEWSSFKLSKMLGWIFYSPKRLMQSCVRIIYDDKQKVSAKNTLFKTLAFDLTSNCWLIGKRLITNPYEVNSILTESIIFSAKSVSFSFVGWDSFLSIMDIGVSNYLIVNATSKVMTPANRILLWNFNSPRFLLRSKGKVSKVTSIM